MARNEDMAAMDFLGGGVHFSYDGGKGRHRQVGPTSQRGKKAGIGCQQGRAREALYADGPGGELGLGVEQACVAWLLGRLLRAELGQCEGAGQAERDEAKLGREKK